MSLAFLWVAYQNYFMPKWKYQEAAWVSVDGTLDDLSIDRVVARHRTRYELLALYTYEYSGKEFTGNRIGYANKFKVDTQAALSKRPAHRASGAAAGAYKMA